MFRRSLFVGTVCCLLAVLPAVAESEAIWLSAEDGVEIRGDLYALGGDGGKAAPFVLLFHQAGSNRGEYMTIAPRLNGLGFNALAIDQRSGKERWGLKNETVGKLGKSTSYLEALPDLEAALQWKQQQGYAGRTLVWGSSYSASLVFLLAAEHGDRIDAVLSFSPGEYLGSRKREVATAAAKVSLPVLILTPEDERARATSIFDAVAGERKELVIPEQAVHGSSMLIAQRNPGAEEVWRRVEEFLEPFTNR